MAKLFFPGKTLKKMKDLGVSEREVLDVFNFGNALTFDSGLRGMEKRFDHQKVLIGMTYAVSNTKNEYSVTSVWKRKVL